MVNEVVDSVALDGWVLQSAYLRMFDAIPDALVIADREGLIRVLNAKTEQVFGYDRAELLGSSVARLFAHEHPFPSAGTVRDDLAAARHRVHEVVARHKRGHLFHADLALSHVALDGQPWTMGALRDASERKHAEHTSSWLASLAQTSNDAIVSTDIDGAISSWSPSAVALFGHTAEQAVGRPSIELTAHEPTRQALLASFACVCRNDGILPWEGCFHTADATEVWVTLRVSRVLDARGNLIGVSIIARDVGSLRQAARDFEQVGLQLRAAVDSFEGLLLLCDADDRIVLCNRHLETLWGGALASPLIERTFSEFVEAMLASRVFVVEGADEGTMLSRWLSHHRRRAGVMRLASSDGHSWLLDDRNTPEGGSVVTFRDCSAHVREARELERARSAAEAASANKSAFLASMSHELCTPLHAILGFGQLLKRGAEGQLTAEQKGYIDGLLQEGERLTRMVEEVLRLARRGVR